MKGFLLIMMVTVACLMTCGPPAALAAETYLNDSTISSAAITPETVAVPQGVLGHLGVINAAEVDGNVQNYDELACRPLRRAFSGAKRLLTFFARC